MTTLPYLDNSKFTPPRALILLTVALLALFGSGCARNTSDSTPVLERAPSTTVPMPPINADTPVGWLTMDNRHVELRNYKGQILVLDFYATWCAPCRKSIPVLNGLQQRFAKNGLQVVGLNVGGADDRIKVPAFQHELNIQYPLGFPDRSLTDLFLSDNQTIPQTFVFASDGRLVKRFIGFEDSTTNELERVITELTAH